MGIEIRDGDIHLFQLHTRMPFKYGIATMTRMPMAFVRVNVKIDGHRSQGMSADLLPPKWFTKDPDKPVPAEIDEMLRVIQHALGLALGMAGESAFDLWWALYQAQSRWAEATFTPPLLAHFGTSLIERAVIEAVCRAAGQPFHQLLLAHRLGLRLGDCHRCLGQADPAKLLPAKPLPELIARHTIGLADPLTDSEIAAADRLDDGLPQSLAACIQAYELSHFKIKVSGDLERDQERLSRIAEVIQRQATRDFAFTLDGNEQFKSSDAFRRFWEALAGQEALRPFLAKVLFVEQPLHRDEALQPAVGEALAHWPHHPPMIIDESDATLESLPQALELGYAGTSHKNCKGIFKGIAHRCLLAQRQRDEPHRRFMMSGEDLCNIGPVALLQDLAVMAALGIGSVERNGHHYVAGLSQFPKPIQEQTLQAHGDLYRRSPAGWPTLNIRQGMIPLHSINEAPFGVGFRMEVEQTGFIRG